MNICQYLQEEIVRPAVAMLPADPATCEPLVKPAQDARHGDYQINCAMALAKSLGRKPRDVAADIVKNLAPGDLLEPPEIAGPGFINLRLRNDWIAGRLRQMAVDTRLGISAVAKPQTFVIDFSSPNVAKPMHVGHLRSTIIGDALVRVLRFQGHRVISDNHLGDWGTQFGILLYGYKHFRNEDALRADPVREMARIYVHVRSLMDTDQDVEDENTANPIAEAARQETARLHAGDAESYRLWQMFMPWCREEIDRIYRRLDVHFDHTLGESFYNPMLAEVVRSLQERGLAEPSQGAMAIFFGEGAAPAIVRKKDGAYTYTTSDLATIRYRVEHWQPDAMLYVVDARQSLHFKNLFTAARRWGYDRVRFEHVSFGSVLGQDRKPIKTREGGAVELGSLLDEAVQRALTVYEQSREERRSRGEDVPELDQAERSRIAEVVGLGAVKYADLSQNRTSDYVFAWEKMLAMDGNTATYMQYAYARIVSIFRKGGEDPASLRLEAGPPMLGTAYERALAVQLLRFAESLQSATNELKPNELTAYLWELAKAYSTFYQNCPVLKAETPALKQSRLLLCDLTARTIQQVLALLGIQTVERM